MLRKHLESIEKQITQAQADLAAGTQHNLPSLAAARDTVQDLLAGLTQLESVLKDAAVKLPLAPHKTTIYNPEGPVYPWVASTNGDLAGVPASEGSQQRDEDRAILLAKCINYLFV